MLDRYRCQTEPDCVNALREIMQELVLLGLWRAKFFEHAAFYGGTALRIFYGLNRWSEDMDFSLLAPNPDFHLSGYAKAIEQELSAFGFSVKYYAKEKKPEYSIDSAFIKTNTKTQMISIGVPDTITDKIHSRKELKIKLEIDIDPPPGFETEVKTLFRPIPHSVRIYALPDLLAGKLHAVLCRKWRNRSKGRDWYDMVLYAAYHPTIHLSHLETRIEQSGDDHDVEKPLTMEGLRLLLSKAIENVDLKSLQEDIRPFIRDQQELDLWDKDFFRQVIQKFKAK